MSPTDAEELVIEEIGETRIKRAVLGAAHGYTVTSPLGVEVFHYTLANAIRAIIKYLGQEGSRDLFILGDGAPGKQW